VEDSHRLWKTYYSKREYANRFVPGGTDRHFPVGQNGDRIGPDTTRDVFHLREAVILQYSAAATPDNL